MMVYSCKFQLIWQRFVNLVKSKIVYLTKMVKKIQLKDTLVNGDS